MYCVSDTCTGTVCQTHVVHMYGVLDPCCTHILCVRPMVYTRTVCQTHVVHTYCVSDPCCTHVSPYTVCQTAWSAWRARTTWCGRAWPQSSRTFPPCVACSTTHVGPPTTTSSPASPTLRTPTSLCMTRPSPTSLWPKCRQVKHHMCGSYKACGSFYVSCLSAAVSTWYVQTSGNDDIVYLIMIHVPCCYWYYIYYSEGLSFLVEWYCYLQILSLYPDTLLLVVFTCITFIKPAY